MPIIRTLKDNSRGAYVMKANFNRREKVNTDLLNALENKPIDSVLPIKSSITPKGSNLEVSLEGLYSIEVRLQDPVSSAECLLLLKGFIDSFQEVMEYGIPADFMVLNLDRIFIRPDGKIAWLTWANENQNNENSFLDLLYTISGLLKPRSKSDEKFIESYGSLFTQDLPDNEAYLNVILAFVTKQYNALEKKIIKEYKEKGHSIEPSGGRNEQVDHLNEIITQKEDLISDLETKLSKSEDDSYEKDEKIAQLQQEIIEARQKIDYLKDTPQPVQQPTRPIQQPTRPIQQPTRPVQQPTRPIQQPIQQPVYIEPEQVVEKPVYREQVETIVPVPTMNTPIQVEKEEPKTGSITEGLVKNFYSDEEDDEFEIDDGTTILGDDEEDVSLHLINDSMGINIDITDSVSYVGKGRQNDIVLKDKAVSGQHARIDFNSSNSEAVITDLNSTNGTFINNKRIKPNVGVLLTEGTVIRFGRNEFIIKYE